jgi:hypothetical protein
MSSAEVRDLLNNGGHLEPLTVEQYHRIIASGILPEGASLELLDGLLVRKDRAAAGEGTVGSRHAWAVHNLGRVLAGLESHGCHLRTQQPITILPVNEPEPDCAIVIGGIDDYQMPIPDPIRSCASSRLRTVPFSMTEARNCGFTPRPAYRST